MQIAGFRSAATTTDMLPTRLRYEDSNAQSRWSRIVVPRDRRSVRPHWWLQIAVAMVALVSLSATLVAMALLLPEQSSAISLAQTGAAERLETLSTEEESLPETLITQEENLPETLSTEEESALKTLISEEERLMEALITEEESPPETVLPKPHPSKNWFPPVALFPKHAKLHNELFISRGSSFDHTVGREKGIILRLNNHIFPMGLSLIKELRCLGNDELIQVYHCLPDELSLANQRRILRLDRRVEIIDVCFEVLSQRVLTLDDVKMFQNSWIKPLAVYHTDLKEVILLDADDLLLQDSARVRHTPGYQANSTMFFYDRVTGAGTVLSKVRKEYDNKPILQFIVDNFDYEAFGLTGAQPSQQLLDSFVYRGQTAHEMHSSMVAIDKTRAGKAMDVLWWIITQLRVKHPEYSNSDKESFWLAYELAHELYAFSPWGVSAVSSATNRDMTTHPDTLCGSLAQYLPANDSTLPELLYVHGGALVDPLTQGVDNRAAPRHMLFNTNASHVVPRLARTKRNTPTKQSFPGECLVGLGSTPLPADFQRLVLRRRLHFLAGASDFLAPLAWCDFEWEH